MGATGSTADASLLRKRSSDVFDRTCVLCPVDWALLWVRAPSGMLRCVHFFLLRWYHRLLLWCWIEERKGPSVCVIAIATRSYCPVHPVIVVIEVRALSPLSSTLVVVFEINACYNLLVFHIYAPRRLNRVTKSANKEGKFQGLRCGFSYRFGAVWCC